MADLHNGYTTPGGKTQGQPPTGSMGAAAIRLSEFGLCVVPAHYPRRFTFYGKPIRGCSCGRRPCPDIGKHPVSDHNEDAVPGPLDPDVLRHAWQHEDLDPWNIALLLGHRSRLIALDFDNKPKYPLSVDERVMLAARHGWCGYTSM